jgi:hypothetical protein
MLALQMALVWRTRSGMFVSLTGIWYSHANVVHYMYLLADHPLLEKLDNFAVIHCDACLSE